MGSKMSTVIKAKNLGKRYFLSHKARSPLKPLLGRKIFRQIHSAKEFWALKDLNFQIAKGESVGIIGPNGAGKTTLLKILCNVTKPSTGNLVVQGSVGSLIELGAGFHAELSGRENIYLYGSILGMKKQALSEKFDQIVEFAELEKFIDIPVKRYSSGMYIRLAFSIAAHMKPDILIVDEVLAVGDLCFQKKCFEWIKNFVQSHRTFLLVSHRLNQIENVCQRVFFIKGGRLVFDGPPDEAISLYLSDSELHNENSEKIHDRSHKEKTGVLDVIRVDLFSQGGGPTKTIIQDEALTLEMHVQIQERIVFPKIEIAFISEGRTLGQANTLSDAAVPEFMEGKEIVTFNWPRCFLSPNNYSLDLYISDGNSGADLFIWHKALNFRVVLPKDNCLGSGKPGVFKIPGKWVFESK
jgi:lipopolysaccharide transport system ATP-binding protein